jgi:hypothetical protein
MQEIRVKTKEKFEKMRAKATNVVKSNGVNKGAMGPIKSLGELQDSIMKMREHFDFVILGKIPSAFPLNKDG